MHRYVKLAVTAVVILAVGLVALAGNGKMNRKQNGTRQCAGICDQDRQQDRLCDCGNFVDEDGDGVCDNCDGQCNPDAPDDDGDGIPNGQDDDYSPPQDGTGRQHGRS